MKIRTKLTIGSLTIALLPMILMGGAFAYLVFEESRETLQNTVNSHLVAIRENKKERIQDYFTQINNQLLALANDRMVIDAMLGFNVALIEIEQKASSIGSNGSDKALSNYYNNQFGREFSKRNSHSSIRPQRLQEKLDPIGVYLQSKYISSNKYPLGQKNNLMASDDGSEYSRLHGLYHPHLNDFLQKFSLYDLFLLDHRTGRVIYSVFKELDYATLLTNGAYSNSGLGRVFKKAANSQKSEVLFDDFKPYLPSYNDPASFIATPIFDGSKKIGVLVFQMPIDRINMIMSDNHRWQLLGLGQTGESYLVGDDFKVRTVNRKLIENKTVFLEELAHTGVENSVLQEIQDRNTNIGLLKVDTEATKLALTGQTGVKEVMGYNNTSVISAYSPLKINGMPWAVVTEMDVSEAYQSIQDLQDKVLLIALVIIAVLGCLLVICGAVFARKLSAPMVMMADKMKSSKGDLTARLDSSGNDELAEIAHYFNKFVMSVQSLVKEISEYSVKLANASEQVSNSSIQTNRNVDDQQRQIMQVASAMSDMNSITQEVVNYADQATEIAKKGDQDTREGGKIIEGTIQAVNQLNNNISAVAQTVNELEHDSQSIGSVLDVIGDIAEQTNLLALNAAIEAARAGEQGRGFAVVADEVRTLASRTQESTSEIKNMIDKLQQVAKQSVEEMSKSLELAEQTAGKAQHGTDALVKLTTAIESINQMTGQIATATEKQTLASSEMSGNINVIRDAASGTVSVSQESARVGEEMAGMAKVLKELVSQFRI